jgi:hypothetical protein
MKFSLKRVENLSTSSSAVSEAQRSGIQASGVTVLPNRSYWAENLSRYENGECKFNTGRGWGGSSGCIVLQFSAPPNGIMPVSYSANAVCRQNTPPLLSSAPAPAFSIAPAAVNSWCTKPGVTITGYSSRQSYSINGTAHVIQNFGGESPLKFVRTQDQSRCIYEVDLEQDLMLKPPSRNLNGLWATALQTLRDRDPNHNWQCPAFEQVVELRYRPNNVRDSLGYKNVYFRQLLPSNGNDLLTRTGRPGIPDTTNGQPNGLLRDCRYSDVGAWGKFQIEFYRP